MVFFVLARADHPLLHPLEILLQAGLGLGREPGSSDGIEDKAITSASAVERKILQGSRPGGKPGLNV